MVRLKTSKKGSPRFKNSHTATNFSEVFFTFQRMHFLDEYQHFFEGPEIK